MLSMIAPPPAAPPPRARFLGRSEPDLPEVEPDFAPEEPEDSAEATPELELEAVEVAVGVPVDCPETPGWLWCRL